MLSAVPVAHPDKAGSGRGSAGRGVPSPISPPSGCRFHPRCPKAAPTCVDSDPVLEPRLGDGADHLAACHFPVEDGEDISKALPTISAEDRVIESGLLGSA